MSEWTVPGEFRSGEFRSGEFRSHRTSSQSGDGRHNDRRRVKQAIAEARRNIRCGLLGEFIEQASPEKILLHVPCIGRHRTSLEDSGKSDVVATPRRTRSLGERDR
jgi:hypothetical protein